jgi:hypothetical protein
MKQKSISKKLSLNKKTVVNLDAVRLLNIKGGNADTEVCPVAATDEGWSFCVCQTEAPTCPLGCTVFTCPTYPYDPGCQIPKTEEG